MRAERAGSCAHRLAIREDDAARNGRSERPFRRRRRCDEKETAVRAISKRDAGARAIYLYTCAPRAPAGRAQDLIPRGEEEKKEKEGKEDVRRASGFPNGDFINTFESFFERKRISRRLLWKQTSMTRSAR